MSSVTGRQPDKFGLVESLKSWIRYLLVRSASGYGLIRRLVLVARFVFKRVHDRDFLAFKYLGASGLFVDVGANMGQSAVSVCSANPHFRLLSFEANMTLERDLRFCKRLLGNRLEYRMVGLGEVESNLDLYVPVVGSTVLAQAATFELGTLEARRETIERRVRRDVQVQKLSARVEVLDDYNLDPAVIKLDVEGGELSVLKGSKATLERHRPILMIENSTSRDNVIDFVRELGYMLFEFDWRTRRLTEFAVEPRSQNFFAISADTAQEIAEAGRLEVAFRKQ